MADRPSARDEDRLPWLEPFGEGAKRKARKPVSRTALVGLLVAFLGVGLAVAFSLGYRVARPSAEVRPPTTGPAQPDTTASVNIPLAPPVPLPEVELSAPQAVSAAPVGVAAMPEAARPVAKKVRPAKAKARKRIAKRKPILRPFINIKKRPELAPAPAPASTSTPAVRPRPVIPFTPRGRAIQVGAYSTQKQADAAYRTLIWRYPYLKTKPKVIAPTQLVGGWRYYRLRLGTATQAQSAVICQRLQAKGQSCIVIY